MRKIAVHLRDDGKCRECGQDILSSNVPSHTHHVIPKKDVEGNHNLNNLKFLCANCHRKQDSYGHENILITPKKRYRPRRSVNFKNLSNLERMWLEAYGVCEKKKKRAKEKYI